MEEPFVSPTQPAPTQKLRQESIKTTPKRIDLFDPFLNSSRLEQVNLRVNKDAKLFPCYQINPYTKKSLEYATRKVNQKPDEIPYENIWEVPGYHAIRDAVWKSVSVPMDRFCSPQTEMHRYGWFPEGQGYGDRENYDERFQYSHRTADFIHVDATIKAYDKMMGVKYERPFRF